jgi:hypothetical protein
MKKPNAINVACKENPSPEENAILRTIWIQLLDYSLVFSNLILVESMKTLIKSLMSFLKMWLKSKKLAVYPRDPYDKI